MNRGPFIFIGVLIIVSLSWGLTLVKPIKEAGKMQARIVQGERIPSIMTGKAQQGSEVYKELGCVSCHTQQTRVTSGNDIARGWGTRQSMPLDYVDQDVVFTGYSRMGPDLANVGTRRTDKEWHLLHLYDPQITSPGSNMPPFKFLFEERDIVGDPSDRALELPEGFRPDAGKEIIPTRDAEALAAYMMALQQSYEIPEAPTPEKLAFK